MSQEIQNAADALRRQAAEKVEGIKGDPRLAEVIQVLTALNALEVLLQQPKTTLAALFAPETGGGAGPVMMTASVAVDEFVNLSPLEAAKQYLDKIGRPARNLDDIIKGIKAGGGDVPNKSALRNQLNRSAEVKAVSGDVFGLAAWYPKKRGRPVGSGGGNGGTHEEGEGDEAGAGDEAGTATPGADLTAPGEDKPEGGEE
jgi:hypothetical protein